VFPDQSWKEYRVQLDPSDVLLLYTDGASEVRRDGRFFGEAGLIETLRRHGGGSPEALPALVLDEVLRFSGGILSDDVALLAVGLRPAGQPDGSPDRSPEGR
jgi:serine phosphatase RsbU (regulator of sigma subunit)